jgi:lipid-A-disaccharide synthase
VKKIAKSVDHILTLFPFESKFYIEHNIPVTCVGHPLADSLPMVNDTEAARLSLGLENDRPVVAVLPGSRGSEVASLGELFLQAASWLNSRLDSVQFVIPAANSQRRQQIDELLNQFQSLNVKVLDGNSLQAMAAADVVLMASGTVTLEAMLLKKPMVVSYRFGKLTYAIFSRLIKTPFASLPNLLAGRALVPELIQNDATVENIGSAVLDFLDNPQRTNDLKTEFVKLHNMLRRNASQVAANVIAELVAQKNG